MKCCSAHFPSLSEAESGFLLGGGAFWLSLLVPAGKWSSLLLRRKQAKGTLFPLAPPSHRRTDGRRTRGREGGKGGCDDRSPPFLFWSCLAALQGETEEEEGPPSRSGIIIGGGGLKGIAICCSGGDTDVAGRRAFTAIPLKEGVMRKNN